MILDPSWFLPPGSGTDAYVKPKKKKVEVVAKSAEPAVVTAEEESKEPKKPYVLTMEDADKIVLADMMGSNVDSYWLKKAKELRRGVADHNRAIERGMESSKPGLRFWLD